MSSPTTSTDEIEASIQKNISWIKLPEEQRIALGNSFREYDKRILDFSIKNQFRYKGNLVKTVKKNEEEYYEQLLDYSRQKLMLFPYHLSDIIVKGLRITPFVYYINMMSDIMEAEKSYDSLPNFTAADGVRLLGIGRNQYIELMNQARSTRSIFRRSKNVKKLLPTCPVEFNIEAWYLLCDGCVLENDIKSLSIEERQIIDKLIDSGPLICGTLDKKLVWSLYNKGLVYLDVPITNLDYVYVPTLDGFVMNRVQGDFLETLLYKIFVTLDGQTTPKDIAEVLETNDELVRDAISVFCRLGFAKKRQTGVETMPLHDSWYDNKNISGLSDLSLNSSNNSNLADLTTSLGTINTEIDDEDDLVSTLDSILGQNNSSEMTQSTTSSTLPTPNLSDPGQKRIAFLFDSSLAAFLMMGNLSTSLKNHAVTLFEVGKLGEEALDNFVEELQNVKFFSEGEAQCYSEHAMTLLHTIQALRITNELDLIRGESLLNLDKNARQRVISKSYRAIFAMGPIHPEACSLPVITSISFFGTPCVQIASPWMKLWLYEKINKEYSEYTLPSIYIPMGTRIRKIPKLLEKTSKILLTTGSHEPLILTTKNSLLTLNDNLLNAAVLIQEYSDNIEDSELINVPFSFKDDLTNEKFKNDETLFINHPVVKKLKDILSLDVLCGYIVLLRIRKNNEQIQNENEENNEINEDKNDNKDSDNMIGTAPWSNTITKDPRKSSNNRIRLNDDETFEDYKLLDVVFGIPLFNELLNKIICNKIIVNDLLSLENMENVKFAVHYLVESSQEFVSKYREFNELSFMETDVNNLPLPTDIVVYDPSNKVEIVADICSDGN